MSPETLEAINHLRSLKLSPKQIARQLGLRPAEVSAAIKQQAIDQAAEQGLDEYTFILENHRKQTGRSMIKISLEEAQSIVYGAVDYAQTLGFNPHKDFERLKTHLGPRPDTLIPIVFGRQGKPFYEEGIDDDSGKVSFKIFHV